MKKYFVEGSLSFMKPEIIFRDKIDFPIFLNIEPTNDCNLSCTMCPRTLSDKKVGYMDFNLFKKIIDECAEHKKVLVLNLLKDGEPLLHPELSQMVKYVREKNAAEIVHFNTNATLLTPEKSETLIDCEVDDITLSIDAYYQETFKKIKGGGSLKKIVSNVKYLKELRDKRKKKKPFLRAKFIEMPETKDEIEKCIEFWKDRVDEVQIQKVHNYGGGVSYGSVNQNNRYPCSFLWQALAINWDGTVNLCCADYTQSDILGDVTKESIYDIFNGEKLSYYRKAMLESRYEEIVSCKNCNIWRVGADITEYLGNNRKKISV